MKKRLFFLLILTAVSPAFGQGYVSFANTTGSRWSTNGVEPGSPTNGVGPGTITVGQFYFELFAAPSTQNTISNTTDPTLNGWTAVHIATNTTHVGRLDGNTEDGGNAAQIPGFAAGSTADFAVAGWSSNIGTSWAQAQAWWNNGAPYGMIGTAPYYFGIATTVANDVQLSSSGGPYNGIFGSGPGLINGWGLQNQNIPEPSTFALAGLGTAAMLIFRRRK